jgi:hypothetical protein
VTGISYNIEDQFFTNIQLPNIPATEILSTVRTNYPVTFDPGDGTPKTETSDINGSVQDELSALAPPPQGIPADFSATRTQNFTVSGFPIATTQGQNYFPTFAQITQTLLSR